MTETATENRDIRLSISAPSGLPLNMGGFLLQAIGRAYPGTEIETGNGRAFGSALSLRIPYDDYVNSDGLTEQDFAEIAPEKDDPGLVAFSSGFRNGSLGMAPPPWLANMLRAVAESMVPMLDDAGATNYLAFEILPQDDGPPFTWIVCRRGAPSPHELRTRAERRVELLEQQLRDLGAEPITDPATESEPAD